MPQQTLAAIIKTPTYAADSSDQLFRTGRTSLRGVDTGRTARHDEWMLFGWSPGIGDPTVYGWVTVVAYFAAAALCLRAGSAGVALTGRLNVWHLLMGALLALGVNKQLDLQTLFTDIGRHVAQDEGWYDRRARVQVVFIAILATLSLSTALGLFVTLRRTGLREKAALGGLSVLAGFVVIRAASFHHVDAMLGYRLGDLKLNNVLELGGIALIGVPAATAPSSAKILARGRHAHSRSNLRRNPTREK